MMEIGIIGYGVVGQATRKMLGEDIDIKILDPEVGYTSDISQSNIIFICINEKDKSMKNLISLVDTLAGINKKGLFVIRTTVIPGTTDRMSIRHKREFVFMPEFLREWNADYDAIRPDKIVIGTENKKTFELIESLFNKRIYTGIIQVKPIEAELAKLALNSLALIKVVFAEELYDLAKALFADYNNIYKIFQLDQNVNVRHLKVGEEKGYKGANGKCLPKDTEFLIHTGEDRSRMALLETAQALNKLYIEVRKG